MTRKEARNRECPFKIKSVLHDAAHGAELYRYASCLGENCPRWEDSFKPFCQPDESTTCADCEKTPYINCENRCGSCR